MNKLSVAIFAPQFRATGVAPAMFSLAQAFSSTGNGATLLASIHEWREKQLDDQGLQVNVHSFRVGALLRLLPAEGWFRFRVSNIIAALLLTLSLSQYLRRQRPGALIVAMQPLVAVLAAMISRSDAKLIISVQGSPRPGKFRIWLWKMLWRRSSVIACESQAIADRLAGILDVASDSIRVIYNPHYDPRILALAQENVPLPTGLMDAKFTIVAVGRLTPQKGFDVLLRAMRSAVNQVDIRLFIIGAGDELEKLEELKLNLGLSDKVVFLGHVINPYPVIAGSDVFVSSSRWEGLARAPIEAQALGVPVIATDIDGGVRETVLEGEAGALVAVGDPEELASAIVSLLGDETRRKKYVEVASRSIDRFSSARAASAYLRVIDDS